MNNNLKFDFTVNRETNSITVKREFAAERSLVWDAYTKAEILDQWWGPKPWMAKTKSMDFSVGGQRLYVMCGPAGEEHWALQNFTAISPESNFKFSDAFCDEEGNINSEMPGATWNVDFIDGENSTTVSMDIKHKTLADLEMIIQMGFKEGFTICLEQLDEVLSSSKK